MSPVLRLGPPDPPPLTEEQCVAAGGHCFARTGHSYPTSPPQYHERCPHCGKGRVAIPREPFEYRDLP